jgi:BCD family chlorophyll transporter-like MFS transporter
MDEQRPGLTVGRNFKIGVFHLGSGMADVLTTGVWNRIMISDLGFSATFVGLLTALRYFLAPLGIWAGRLSDERAVGGYRRLVWIWGGRLMMVISTFMLGMATTQLAQGSGTSSTWVAIVSAMFLFSIGSAVSGTTYLALIYDRAHEHQRGRAVGIAWTFLLLGFTIGGIFFGILLPEHKEGQIGLSFAPEALQNLFIITGVIFAALWFFSVLGEEKRGAAAKTKTADIESVSIRQDLALVWQSRPLRFFLLYLTASMFFAFSQDAILEPFGGDVFGMPAETTNRFAAYWGSMAILGTIAFLFLSRRLPQLTNTVMSQLGMAFLTVSFALLTVSAVLEIRPLVTINLILLGIGLGIWNVGTLGLMMDLSPSGRAGTFLGFWTMMVTLARGGGVATGGIVRDLGLELSGSMPIAYGAVFAIGTLGLLAALWALHQVNVKEFKKEAAPVDAVLAGAMD